MISEKTCRTCGYVGPAEDFVKTKHKCKKCQAAYDLEFRAKQLAAYDPEAIRECIYCGHVGPASGFRERKNECNSCVGENAKKSRTTRLENFDPTKIKTCIYCGHVGPALEFDEGNSCKVCRYAKHSVYQKEHYEEIRTKRFVVCSECGTSVPKSEISKNTTRCKTCMAGNRVCTKCDYEGPEQEFVDSSHICKKCSAAEYKKYREDNADYFKAYAKEYGEANKEVLGLKAKARRLANLEERKMKDKAYYYKNIEIIKVRGKKYRELNKNKIKIKNMKWRLSHKEHLTIKRREKLDENRPKKRVYSLNYLARKKNAPGYFTLEDVEEMWIEQTGRCVYCGARLRDSDPVDHIVPLVKGGTNWPSNLQLLCNPCNCSKGPKSHEEFLGYRRLLGLVIFREAA